MVFDGYILLGGTLEAQLGWTQHYRHFHPPCRINREIEVLIPSALGSEDSRSHAGCWDGVLLCYGAIIPEAQQFPFQHLSFPVSKTFVLARLMEHLQEDLSSVMGWERCIKWKERPRTLHLHNVGILTASQKDLKRRDITRGLIMTHCHQEESPSPGQLLLGNRSLCPSI